MTGTGTFGIGRAQSDYPLRILPLRAAKPYSFSRFHDERGGNQANRRDVVESINASEASRFETKPVEFPYAPRLSSAFAAQVLGQILIKNEHKASLSAYRQRPRSLARICDFSA